MLSGGGGLDSRTVSLHYAMFPPRSAQSTDIGVYTAADGSGPHCQRALCHLPAGRARWHPLLEVVRFHGGGAGGALPPTAGGGGATPSLPALVTPGSGRLGSGGSLLWVGGAPGDRCPLWSQITKLKTDRVMRLVWG